MNGKHRAEIQIGARVRVVLKKDQPTGKPTEGVVARILTRSPDHPRGVKALPEGGRSQEIDSARKENAL